MKSIAKQRTVELEFMKCNAACGFESIHEKDRHYPLYGTEGNDERYRMSLLNVMVGPSSLAHRWENLSLLRKPENYKLFTSFHHGSEEWSRYWWWNGRVPKLTPGDIVQERYDVRAPPHSGGYSVISW